MAIKKFSGLGSIYGQLTVVAVDRYESRSGYFVKVRCTCGNYKIVRFQYLPSGHTTSCGCARATFNRSRLTHGHAARGAWTETYSVYRDMMTRCLNPNYREFHLYGGRGISVCERWAGNYANFLQDMGERPAGLTLDRIGVDKNYEPENCRWVTLEVQANNKRNSVFIEHDGVRQTVAQWSRALGIKAGTIYCRLSKGDAPVDALRAVQQNINSTPTSGLFSPGGVTTWSPQTNPHSCN